MFFYDSTDIKIEAKKNRAKLCFFNRVPQGSKVRFSLAPWILSLESLVDLQAIFYHRLLQMLSPFGLFLQLLSRSPVCSWSLVGCCWYYLYYYFLQSCQHFFLKKFKFFLRQKKCLFI